MIYYSVSYRYSKWSNVLTRLKRLWKAGQPTDMFCENCYWFYDVTS